MYLGKIPLRLATPCSTEVFRSDLKVEKDCQQIKKYFLGNPFETSHPCSPVESHFPGQVVQGRDTDSVRSPITEQSSVLRLSSKFTARHLMLLPFICNVNV